MNFFEKEMRQMFDDNDIFQDAKFVGKTMLAKLDDDLRIKLQFIASHISGQYDTVQMTIINRTDGMVDKQNFKFSDIIGKCIRPGREPLDYHMWEYNNKPEWYTPISLTDKARIADTFRYQLFCYANIVNQSVLLRFIANSRVPTTTMTPVPIKIQNGSGSNFSSCSSSCGLVLSGSEGCDGSG